jgi:hypothetical protein
MERIAMSQEERGWLDWIERARDGKMTQREAGERGSQAAAADEDAGRRRSGAWAAGRASNRKIDPQVQAQAIDILKQPGIGTFHFGSDRLSHHYCRAKVKSS